MTELEVKQLCDRVRQVAYDIHVYLGPGHLEKVYEAALVHRLRKANVDVKPPPVVRMKQSGIWESLDSVLLHPGDNVSSFIARKRFFNGERFFNPQQYADKNVRAP
jgi:hypothetical protein